MPYVTRKKRPIDMAGEVLMAPFVFLLTGVLVHRVALLLVLLAFGFCLVVDLLLLGGLNARVVFSSEFAATLLGVICLLWFAAGICAGWDYWRTRGNERVWDNSCVELSHRFADCLITENFAAAYELTALSYRANVSPGVFESTHRSAWTDDGKPDRLIGVREYTTADALSDTRAFPPDVPESRRRALTRAALHATTRAGWAYELSLTIIAEDPGDRVCAFAYRSVDAFEIEEEFGVAAC